MGWSDDYLEHHGILGQKWGVRRFENKNGHLTPAGLKRYEDGRKVTEKEKHAFSAKAAGHKALAKAYEVNEKFYSKNKALSSANKSAKNQQLKKAEEAQKKADEKRSDPEAAAKRKKLIIAGAAIAGTALAAYGGYKLYQLNKQATEGLSKDYHNQAVKEFTNSKKLEAKYNSDRSSKTLNEALNAHDRGEVLQDLAKNKKYSIGEKAAYLNLQKAKASVAPKTNDDQLKSKKAVTKAIKDYSREKTAWDKKTINLESQKKMAERMGNEAKANRIEKKLANTPPPVPPQFSKKGQAATNKLASEASALARSVTAEGPKSFSKPAQNGGQTRPQSSAQQLKANRVSNGTMASGSNTISRTMKVSGQTTFNQASKANDDFVNDLLKKNAKALGL